jgi:plastocyanin
MLSILLALVPAALAAQQTIIVGKGGDTFTPDTITAAKGDTVKFTFAETGHSVSASAYDSPCKPASDTTFFSDDGVPVSSQFCFWMVTSDKDHTDIHRVNPSSSR